MGRSPWRLALLLIPLVSACFALTPSVQGQNSENTHLGDQALASTKPGVQNTAIGFQAMQKTSGGTANTATGYVALKSNTTGDGNTATGNRALASNTTGQANMANGTQALFSNMTGKFNTAIGTMSLYNNRAGERNTAIGFSALENSTGSFNVALGAGAGSGVITANDVICIGRSVAGVDVSGTCFIGNIRGVTTQNGNALPVVIDGAGQLGTMSSSKRFKKEIKPMENASDSLLRLNPVTFHYKSDGTDTPQFGLIAEDVAKVNPDLVVRDDSGEIYTVRYDAVNAMLLNEFLKEHQTVQGQQKEIDALKAELKEQKALIQKVSDKVELSKPVPHVVNNP
jgi:hypothetical protein